MYGQDFIANDGCSNVQSFFVFDYIMCLFHNFVTLIVKRFACLFDCIQQVGSNDVNLKRVHPTLNWYDSCIQCHQI